MRYQNVKVWWDGIPISFKLKRRNLKGGSAIIWRVRRAEYFKSFKLNVLMFQIYAPLFKLIDDELPTVFARELFVVCFPFFRVNIRIKNDLMIARNDDFMFPSFKCIEKLNKTSKISILSIISKIAWEIKIKYLQKLVYHLTIELNVLGYSIHHACHWLHKSWAVWLQIIVFFAFYYLDFLITVSLIKFFHFYTK